MHKQPVEIKPVRADAVKEVQVFDKKSEQAEFTGIDDGKTQKTINLKLKDDKKTGYFGKIDVSGGPQKNISDRYNNNLLISSFKGKRKLSAFLLNGNTGQDGLRWEDERKYGGSDMTINMDDDGGLYIWRGGTSDDEPYFDPQNGFVTNVNAGVQYSNKWNDKHTFNFSPKYNSQDYDNQKQTFTQTQLGDSVLNETANNVTHINRHNFKNKIIYDVKLDSNNSLKFIGGANFYSTKSDEARNAISTGTNGTLKNSSDRLLQTNSDKNAITGNLIFKHRFKKNRRTLSVTADWNTLNTAGTNFLKSFNQAYLNGTSSGSQQLDQMKDYDMNTKNLSSKIVYTEPLGKKYALELAYGVAYNYGNNSQLTYSYSPLSGKYDYTVDSLSNQFKQSILQNIPSTKISYASKKLKVNAGAGFGITDFTLKDLTYSKDYNRNFINFYPSAGLAYTYKANHDLRFRYDGNTTQPTINQLQPLRNNNDYFNQYIGNPQLKPSFGNSFNLSHGGYNFIKDIWAYQSLDLRVTSNSITNSRTINIDSGKTITQPINTNGNISLNFWSGVGFKLKKLDTRINFNPQFGYNKYADIINGKKSFSKNLNTGLQAWISKSKEKKYDVSLGNEFNYNSNTTSQNDTKIHYSTNTFSVNGTVYYKKVWSLTSDYRFLWRQKIVQFNSNLNNHLWNARFERTFKNNEFSVYLDVRDILNQNIGIERNFFSNTFSEVRNDRLKRFFFIGFKWDFKNKGATK